MTNCYDEGSLRAYLDDALAPAGREEVSLHLDGCPTCRVRLEELRLMAGRAAQLLTLRSPAVDAQAALVRLRSTATADGKPEQRPAHVSRSLFDPKLWRLTIPMGAMLRSPYRRTLATGFACLLALGLLLLPPVRAMADQLLQVFRVRSVMLMPLDAERIEQLQQLDFDESALFVAEPRVVNDPQEPRVVDSLAEASQAVGFEVKQPTDFPDAQRETSIMVHDRTVFEFQVDVDTARQLLTLLEVRDVTIPDALGEQPIRANLPRFATPQWSGSGWKMTLFQGTSPAVTMPDGVDLQELGKVALRLLGMEPAEAERLSRQIDWTSTLILPIPPEVRQVRQVTVGDATGMLVGGEGEVGQRWMLYWQEDDRFFVLEGEGEVEGEDMLAAANSIQ